MDLRPIISKEMALEDIEEAMQLLDGGEAGKIILRPNAEVEMPESSIQGRKEDPNVQGRLFHR